MVIGASRREALVVPVMTTGAAPPPGMVADGQKVLVAEVGSSRGLMKGILLIVVPLALRIGSSVFMKMLFGVGTLSSSIIKYATLMADSANTREKFFWN